MTEEKNGRLLLSIPATAGMILCIITCIIITTITMQSLTVMRRVLYTCVLIFIVLSSFSSLYMGDLKRIRRYGTSARGRDIQSVCGLCDKQYGFISGFVMTFVMSLPILIMSIKYRLKTENNK